MAYAKSSNTSLSSKGLAPSAVSVFSVDKSQQHPPRASGFSVLLQRLYMLLAKLRSCEPRPFLTSILLLSPPPPPHTRVPMDDRPLRARHEKAVCYANTRNSMRVEHPLAAMKIMGGSCVYSVRVRLFKAAISCPRRGTWKPNVFHLRKARASFSRASSAAIRSARCGSSCSFLCSTFFCLTSWLRGS